MFKQRAAALPPHWARHTHLGDRQVHASKLETSTSRQGHVMVCELNSSVNNYAPSQTRLYGMEYNTRITPTVSGGVRSL
jgi:hypothetical protein